MEIASTYYKSNEIRGSYRWNSQSSPVQNVMSPTKTPFIKLYISLHNMFRCFVIPHSQWHFLLLKTTLYDDSLKKAFQDKQMAAVRLLGENQIKKKEV